MKTVFTEKAPAAVGPYSQAQIAGEVTDLDSAKAFVQEYAKKSVG